MPRPRSARKRRSRPDRVLPSVKQHKPARTYLRGLKMPPTIWEWESLLVDEVLWRFPTKTEAAAALGLSREGFRKKLIRMGLDT